MIDVVTAISAGVGTFAAAVIAELVRSFVRNSQGIEKRRDDDLEEILAALATLRDLADRYWSKSAADLGPEEPILRSHITANVHHINLIVADLLTGAAKRACDIAYMPFMRSIAGDTFGNDDREAQPERLSQIHQTALSFRRKAIASRRALRRKPLA